MFLFKNTKNLAKRIIMNIAVFGWIGVFVTMLLTIILPDNFHKIFYYLIVISSFSALIGTVVSIVWSIVEFFVNILSGNKGSNPTSTKSVSPAMSAKVENKAFTFEAIKTPNSVPEDKEAHFNFGKNREDIIADRYVHKISRENHILYNLFQVPPADGWEIAIIGLDILNGKPYRNDSRQKCYGVTTACEDSWLPLTYDEVRQLAATVSFSGADLSDLNDRTWTEYIPKEFIEKSQPKPVLPQVYPCEKFSESRSLDIDAISVHTKFRFGENYQFLRKCSTGYRVFSASGERFYKMFPDCPTEEYLHDVLNGKIRVGDLEAHDRLLNEDEVKYFAELINSCGLYLSPKVATQTIDISIYGGETVRAYYYKDSKQIPCACKTVHDIGSDISTCAKRGVKKEFNKEIILKQPQRYRSVATINECNTGVSEFINYTPEKAYEQGYDSYSLYLDIENGDFVFVHRVLEHVGAAYDSRIIFAECIDYDTVRNILSCEIDCLKSLTAKQEDEGIHNESIELRCKEIEKIINASPADLRKIIFEENENRCICERCKKVISESESVLTDNHRFCKECASPTKNSDKHLKDKVSDTVYQARMDFERGGSPSFESSLGNRGMFTCSNCHNVLPQKYLHSNCICSSCATELNIQTVKPVKSSCLDIKLGEKFDGGFTEYYISLCKDIKGYYIYEYSWHYNAGVETHISTKYLDDSQIKNFSLDSFIRFIKSQYPEYEIDDEYLKDNIDLLRVFKKEKICQSGLDEETFQEGQKQSKNI